MKKEKDLNVGWYLFALVGGIASGLMFSKSQYYKGQYDAYEEIGKDLQDSLDSIKENQKEEVEAD